MATTPHNQPEPWKIDKHIPIALIISMIVQVGSVVWWVSGLQHSVQDHERRIAMQESGKVVERMAVVESQLRDSRELQIRMDQKLDRILDTKGR